jgi:dTDP-4-amino-4,6-dideoxygalactose transaminase
MFVDVREPDGLMDPADAAGAVSSRTRAIVPVHILRAKPGHLERWNGARRRIAARYRDAVEGTALKLLEVDPTRDVVHQAVVCSAERDALADHLRGAGIATQIHYPVPIQAAAVSRSRPPAGLPVTERLAGQVLSLPRYPELDDEQIERVCTALGA